MLQLFPQKPDARANIFIIDLLFEKTEEGNSSWLVSRCDHLRYFQRLIIQRIDLELRPYNLYKNVCNQWVSDT